MEKSDNPGRFIKNIRDRTNFLSNNHGKRKEYYNLIKNMKHKKIRDKQIKLIEQKEKLHTI